MEQVTEESPVLFNETVWNDLLEHDRQMTATKKELPTDMETEMGIAAAPVPTKAGKIEVTNGKPDPAITKVANPLNWCGQAAVATVLTAWGLNPYKGTNKMNQLLSDVYKKYPPDIMGGNWGTSPGRIVEALRGFGMKKSTDLFLEPWHLGGFMNPINQFAWQGYSKAVEKSIINAGKPVIVLVDSGKVGGSWYNLHWLVCYQVNQSTVSLCNAINSQKAYDYLALNINEFHQAWECNFVPLAGLRFNAVIPSF